MPLATVATVARRAGPIVFVGETRSRSLLSALKLAGVGRMFSYALPTPTLGERWAFDNGAYLAWRTGSSFPICRFLHRLDAGISFHVPYLAVCPDIVAGGIRSLEFSLIHRRSLPNRWPWYLAVQDGMTAAQVAPNLARFRGIFLGGTNKFKTTAQSWADLAHRNGLRFHYGRAGTERKVAHAIEVGADSLDSSFPLWSRGRMSQFLGWIEHGPDHELLPCR